jgi:hypothetical protein
MRGADPIQQVALGVLQLLEAVSDVEHVLVHLDFDLSFFAIQL